MKCPEKANIETESPSVLPGLGWEWGLTANAHEGSFGGDAIFLQLGCGDGCTTLWIYFKKNH